MLRIEIKYTKWSEAYQIHVQNREIIYRPYMITMNGAKRILNSLGIKSAIVIDVNSILIAK